MTEQQKHNIRAAFGIWKRNDVTDTEFVEWLDKILSLPAPTQDGTAEEVIQELLDIEYHDDPQYANLESALISRKYCIQAMHNYDAPLRAEIERLKSELAASVSPKLVMPEKTYSELCDIAKEEGLSAFGATIFIEGYNLSMSELRRLNPSLFK